MKPCARGRVRAFVFMPTMNVICTSGRSRPGRVRMKPPASAAFDASMPRRCNR
jgi:hypothetical protein